MGGSRSCGEIKMLARVAGVLVIAGSAVAPAIRGSGAVFCDVCDPKLVGLNARELAVDQISSSRVEPGTFRVTTPQRQTHEPSVSHEDSNLVVANNDAAAKAQLSMNPKSPIGAARRDMDLGDHVGEPDIADSSRR